MPKERNINPATAALKASKARAIKKSKSVLAHARTERLARRNPLRIQQQIDALRDANADGQQLRPRDKERLERLEREMGAVKRAKERVGGAVGDDADAGGEGDRRERGEGGRGRGRGGRGDRGGDRGRGRGGGGVLGKRWRDGERIPHEDDASNNNNSSDTDSDARDIPMPTDDANRPPIPRNHHYRHRPNRPGQADANDIPVRAPAPAQTVYSSAPQVRNLQKEATARFVPAAVASKLAAVQGTGGGRLLEPEEADALEKSGYHRAGPPTVTKDIAAEAQQAAEGATEEAEKEVEYRLMALEAELGEAKTLEEEEKRFRREARKVEIEEVEDEDL